MLGRLFTSLLACIAAYFAALYITDTSFEGCATERFEDLTIPHAKIISVSASPITRYKRFGSKLDFCNVTVTYTHPEWNERIHTTVWLRASSWNELLQGIRGGGYGVRHGDDFILEEPVAKGYAVVATDGGHSPVMWNSKNWSLDASGHVNMPLFKDFAYVAMSEIALIGKAVARFFYGRGPKYSYWNGCSTGGRQGLLLAQQYPTAFDGIYASAPAINWPSFIVGSLWETIGTSL